ncbi:helix-turn-helix domain-containing protein [Clostridium akagii]|uniref:helix-turn-helix domain-containing protein n=1 Tax=Clostridium akagii TaxID=91623 RepID=UPI00055A5010|nr:helix-turn-helix domain-containing protein [Clostridium akagii]
MKDISIITTDDRRLFPAKIYDNIDNLHMKLATGINDIYNLLYEKQNIFVISNQYDKYGSKLDVFNGTLGKDDIKALFATNDEESTTDLSAIMTLSEAAKKWNLSDGSTIRKAIERKKFQKNEIKLAGDIWIVTYSAMERVFGSVKNEESEYILYDDFEIYLYKTYLNNYKLDYLEGNLYDKKVKENETQYQYVKKIFVDALDAIRNNQKVIIKRSKNNKVRQIISSEKELFSYIEVFSVRSRSAITPLGALKYRLIEELVEIDKK